MKVFLEELVELEIFVGGKLLKRVDLVEEVGFMVIDEDRIFNLGDIVWVKVKGYFMWLVIVMDEDYVSVCDMEFGKKGMILL